MLDQTTDTFRIGFHVGTLGLASDSKEEVKVDSAISCVDAFDAARAVRLFAPVFSSITNPRLSPHLAYQHKLYPPLLERTHISSNNSSHQLC